MQFRCRNVPTIGPIMACLCQRHKNRSSAARYRVNALSPIHSFFLFRLFLPPLIWQGSWHVMTYIDVEKIHARAPKPLESMLVNPTRSVWIGGGWELNPQISAQPPRQISHDNLGNRFQPTNVFGYHKCLVCVFYTHILRAFGYTITRLHCRNYGCRDFRCNS